MTDVVKPGDVIYVSPREPTDKQPDVTGQWSLQQVPKISGALVAMDPHTGRVLALIGGFSFAESQFDRAVQARRQPGSSFKPIIYTTALDNGYTPASIIVDGRLCVSQGAGMPKWCPKMGPPRRPPPWIRAVYVPSSTKIRTAMRQHNFCN
jgi:penicillin-binding protein 1A